MKRRTRILLITVPLGILLTVALAVGWVVNTQGGAQWALRQALSGLGESARFDSAEGSLSDGFRIKGISYDAGSHIITIEKAELSLELSLSGPAVNIQSLTATGVTIRETGVSASGNREPVSIEEALADFSAPVAVDFQNVMINDVEYRNWPGEIVLAVDELVLSGQWHENLENLSLQLTFPGVKANLKGRLALDGQGDSDLSGKAGANARQIAEVLPEDVVIEYRIQPDFESVDVILSSESFGLEAQGTIGSLITGPQLDISLNMAQFLLPIELETGVMSLQGISGKVRGSLSEYVLDVRAMLLMGGGETISLDLAGTGNEQGIEVDMLKADGEFVSATANGRLDWQSEPVIEARIDWQDVHWPALPREPIWSSREGSGQISGGLDSWAVKAELDFETLDYPGGEFVLTGSGNTNKGDFKFERGEALGGTLAGTVSVDWTEEVNTKANLTVKRLDLGALFEDWPARLDSTFALEYQDGDNGHFSIDFEHLEGTYREHPLSGTGSLDYRLGQLSFRDFNIASGNSRLSGDGSMDRPEGLFIEADITRPGLLSEIIGGNLSGQLRFAPLSRQPLSQVNLIASDLHLGDIVINKASALTKQLNDDEHLDVTVQAEGIRSGDIYLDSVEIGLDGNLDQQLAKINLASGEYRAEIGLEGRVLDWTRLTEAGWEGQLKSLEIHDQVQQLLGLDSMADLAFDDDHFNLDEICLDFPEEGAVCLELDLQGEILKLDTRLDDVPLEITHLFTDHDIEFTQRLNGSASWHQLPGIKPSGNLEIVISAGQFGEAGDEDRMASTGEGFIGFRLDEGDLTTGQFDITFPGAGLIDIDFSIDGMALDGTGEVAGRALIELETLSFLDGLTRYIDGIDGSLSSKLRLSGRTGSPTLDGELNLQDAEFEVPLLGSRVTGLSLQGSVADTDRLLLKGEYSVGEGRGDLKINGDFSDLNKLRMETLLSGHNLRIVDLPDLVMDIDPDVSLDYSSGNWVIDGRIDVPRATLSPITSFVSKVGESTDLVVVRGKRSPVLETGVTDELLLGGALGIHLGDEVRLEADSASLALGGSVDLAWRGPLMPYAEGAVSINGDITAWGPVLRITNGRVRWADVPANNPALDIRAERNVFGNTVVRAAGVRIGGTARRPEIEAYTNPLTTRDRAWAVLVTGSDVNFGQGVGALDLGTYIAPRIFLSYGISLFETENVVGLRYDLKKGWGIKATSGQRESGIDLSYTIEK